MYFLPKNSLNAEVLNAMGVSKLYFRHLLPVLSNLT